jgi:hypothetical protein
VVVPGEFDRHRALMLEAFDPEPLVEMDLGVDDHRLAN